MNTYRQQFIQFALAHGALLFGEFTLKSGRQSPYFFNSGKFIDGGAFHQLGHFYAKTIVENFKDQYDVLFGPAYKGIQLATVASVGLNIQEHLHVPVCYNRKEAKDHGEGGVLVGAPLAGKRVLLVDDVITAGTALRHSAQLIQEAGGRLIGAVIALDRQERGVGTGRVCIQEIEQTYQLKVASIISLTHLIDYLQKNATQEQDKRHLQSILDYQRQYGAVE